jgi:murein DD-endopeptidase MepM/ murein hydrolase activator NlpD
MAVVPHLVAPVVGGVLLLLPLPDAGSPPGSGPWSPPGPSTGVRVAPTTPVPPDGGADRPVPRRRWQWPLAHHPPVLRSFTAPSDPYGPGHRGVDLGAAAGARVLAVEEGVVTHAGRVAGRGTVTVTHADGLASTYEPVRARVVAGTPVAAGDVLGVLEPPSEVPTGGHCLLVACLHLGARRDGAYLDPLLLLRGGRVRLLPVPPLRPGPRQDARAGPSPAGSTGRAGQSRTGYGLGWHPQRCSVCGTITEARSPLPVQPSWPSPR